MERRERVKRKCADRHNQLMSSQALQEFKRNADEVSKTLGQADINNTHIHNFIVILRSPMGLRKKWC